MGEQELPPAFVEPEEKVPQRGLAFGKHFLEGFVARRDLPGRLEFREACERRNERVVGGDLQAAIRRVAAVEELQGQRVQDRKVRDRVIGGERVAKAERMIGGQLGHELVGKVRAVLVNGGQGIEVAGFFDGFAACIILIFAVKFAGVGWGSGRAAIGFGHNVGHAAETGFDVQAAIIGDADKNAGLGLLLIRIDRQLGVEFFKPCLDCCHAFAGFGVEFVEIINGVFDFLQVRPRGCPCSSSSASVSAGATGLMAR